MSTILALETATPACSVALMHAGQVYSRFELAPREHASKILVMVDAVLTEAGIAVAELDAVAYGSGPGSFMGVRIATAVAQGLAYATNAPVVALSTLQVLAQTAFQGHAAEAVVAAWDARMDEVYWGVYALDSQGLMQAVEQDRLSKPDEMSVPDQSGLQAVGNAWQEYADAIAVDLPVIRNLYPSAEAALPLAEQAMADGAAVEASRAEPLYLRNNVAKVPRSPVKS